MSAETARDAETVAALWPDAPPMIGTQNAAVVRYWQAEAVRLALALGARNTEAERLGIALMVAGVPAAMVDQIARIDGHEADNPQGVWCCQEHRDEHYARTHNDGEDGRV